MKRYQVSKHFIHTFWIFCVSCVLLLFYVMGILRYYFPIELDEFNARLLKKDQYVRINIQECLPTKGSGKTEEGLSIGMVKDYWNYTVQLGRSAYIRVGISDESVRDKINSWPGGRGKEPVQMIGRVDQTRFSKAVYEWYDNNTDLDRDMIVPDTMIYQVTAKEIGTKYNILFFLGGIGLCIAFLLFCTIGGIRSVYVTPFEDTKRYRDYVLGRSYQLERDLEREKKVYDEICKEQKDMFGWFWKGILICIGIFVAMIFFYILYIGANSLFASYVFLALTFCFIWGIKFVWHSFLNTDSPLAYKISDLFLLRNCSIRREESSKLITLMSQKLDEKKEKDHGENGEGQVLMWYGPGVWEKPDLNNEDEGGTDENNATE